MCRFSLQVLSSNIFQLLLQHCFDIQNNFASPLKSQFRQVVQCSVTTFKTQNFLCEEKKEKFSFNFISQFLRPEATMMQLMDNNNSFIIYWNVGRGERIIFSLSLKNIFVDHFLILKNILSPYILYGVINYHFPLRYIY